MVNCFLRSQYQLETILLNTLSTVQKIIPEGKLSPTVSIAIRNDPTEYFTYSTTDNT